MRCVPSDVLVCNKERQIRAWHAHHKYECKHFRRHPQFFAQHIIRAFIRPLLLREKDVITEQDWNEIMSLVMHPDKDDDIERESCCRQVLS